MKFENVKRNVQISREEFANQIRETFKKTTVPSTIVESFIHRVTSQMYGDVKITVDSREEDGKYFLSCEFSRPNLYAGKQTYSSFSGELQFYPESNEHVSRIREIERDGSEVIADNDSFVRISRGAKEGKKAFELTSTTDSLSARNGENRKYVTRYREFFDELGIEWSSKYETRDIKTKEKYRLGGETHYYPAFADMMTMPKTALSDETTLFETYRDDSKRPDMLHCHDRSGGTYSVTNLRGEHGSLASFWQSTNINYGWTGEDYISEEELEELTKFDTPEQRERFKQIYLRTKEISR